MKEKIVMFLNEYTLNVICSIWILFIGFIILGAFFFGEKNIFLKSVGDFFIYFSFVKRSKNILLAYGIFAILIGLIGVIYWLG